MSGLPKEISYTKIPNFIIETLMAELRGGELKVAIAICRKTFGYHKMTDAIALSQIMDLTGLTKKTVIDALRNLVKKKVIHKNVSTIPYEYSINLVNYIDTKPQKQNLKSDEGIKITPEGVKKVNHSRVEKLNSQKKTLKESKRNTTSSGLSDELTEVISYWNKIFSNTLDPSDSKLVKCIEEALNNFTVKKIKKAIFNRSHCSYYRDKKPQLLNKPSAFFPYPETITNDLSRNPECIFDYDEKNQRIWEKKNVDEDFEILWDRKDEKDRPMWKLSTANY